LCGEIVAVQAFVSSATRNFPVEDTVSISLRFANGVLGSFMLSDTVAVPRSWEQTTQEDPIFAAIRTKTVTSLRARMARSQFRPCV
jgi:hypothetical protein